MKQLVRKIFGDEAANNPETVEMYVETQKIAMDEYAKEYHKKQLDTLLGLGRSFELAFDTINCPVRYDSYAQQIFDCKNNLLFQIRGWGHIQYLTNATERQDDIGRMLCAVINKCASVNIMLKQD